MNTPLQTFAQLKRGIQDRFRYHGDTFSAYRDGPTWIITRVISGDTAHCTFPITRIADLWNVADCLHLYEKHLYIDEDFVIHLTNNTAL